MPQSAHVIMGKGIDKHLKIGVAAVRENFGKKKKFPGQGILISVGNLEKSEKSGKSQGI